MKKRWYDHDPTLSMAVSLLQNASRPNQIRVAEYLFTLLEKEQALAGTQVSDWLRVTYLFPFARRDKLEQSAWRLLEVMKHLPADLQMEMALNLIQYVYLLDGEAEGLVPQGAAMPVDSVVGID